MDVMIEEVSGAYKWQDRNVRLKIRFKKGIYNARKESMMAQIDKPIN